MEINERVKNSYKAILAKDVDPHEGGSKIYEVEYLKDDVEKMLKAYIKQTELDKQKKKYERI